MPMYEYRCISCGEVFELMQKFSDEPLRQHPSCGGSVERLLSAPALQFKGSGWYVTDYARAGTNGKDGKESKEAAAKADTAGTKAETGAKAAAASSSSASPKAPASSSASKE
jgi:putative FmdB family regulatory protein